MKEGSLKRLLGYTFRYKWSFFISVIGFISFAFADIAAAENISPKIVANGIGHALYTTAFGLVVAVIIQFGQNTVMFIIDNLIVTIQKSMTVVLQSIAKKHDK